MPRRLNSRIASRAQRNWRFDAIFAERIREADESYATVIPADLTQDARNVMRQALAGMLWSKQFYHYVVRDWLKGDPPAPPPPAGRVYGRNHEWSHLYNADVTQCPISGSIRGTPHGIWRSIACRWRWWIASYKGLLPLVKSAAPEGYRVIMAHQCSYAGRKFVHLTLRHGGSLASIVILRKNAGESFAGMTPKESASGFTLFQASAQRYKVVSFESGQYLAFVVSDQKDETNLQLAERLAPTVGEFLEKPAA